jgi:hypothetical protein
MSSYFDITAGLPNNASSEYRFYKCLKNTCKRVATNDKTTVNIPSIMPENLDKYILRYHLKTFFPISIS